MKHQSLQISRFGGPGVFQLIEEEAAPLRPDEVRIQVSASGVNFADLMMRMGLYPEAPKAPFVPGYEVAGTILEAGNQVRGLQPGDRVLAGCKFGGYTTEIVLPQFQVRKIPDHLDYAEAASIPVTFMTAWVALQEMARIRKGDRVLVQSAAGGVGVAAVQIAARAGAEVVGLVGSESKAPAVKELGAHEVWTNQRWEEDDDANLGGFDVILDPTGGPSLKRSMKRLGPTGRVISFGVSTMISGQKRSIGNVLRTLVQTPIFTPFGLMTGNKGIFGLNMLQLFSDPIHLARALDGVLRGFEQKQYKTVVGKTFPLAEGGAAHDYLQSRANIGKVVLVSKPGNS